MAPGERVGESTDCALDSAVPTKRSEFDEAADRGLQDEGRRLASGLVKRGACSPETHRTVPVKPRTWPPEQRHCQLAQIRLHRQRITRVSTRVRSATEAACKALDAVDAELASIERWLLTGKPRDASDATPQPLPVEPDLPPSPVTRRDCPAAWTIRPPRK